MIFSYQKENVYFISDSHSYPDGDDVKVTDACPQTLEIWHLEQLL